MAATSRLTASALFGVCMVLGGSAAMQAQPLPGTTPAPRPGTGRAQSVPSVPLVTTGSVSGEVRDDRGRALPGAVVSLVGATVAIAVTDETGRFEALALPPGIYQVRAHASGYTAPRLKPIQVRPGVKTPSSFLLQSESVEAPGLAATGGPAPGILAAGLGLGETPPEPAPQPVATTGSAEGTTSSPGAPIHEPTEQTEAGWRVRHLRRGVLRETSLPGDFSFDDDEKSASTFAGFAGRAVSTSARAATSLFADVPLSGQFQLLTTNSFDAPRQALSGLTVARGIAYVKVGAPVGERADWTVRGAITEADLASWFVGGTYKARASERRAYELGLSYSTQRYVGGNLLALRDVSDGSRNVTNVYGYETLTITPAVDVSYGAEYGRYDYLQRRDLVSPRAAISVGTPLSTRLSVSVSSHAEAPGAGEFLPPGENGLWLPPQRTFSSMTSGSPMLAERATQIEGSLERGFGPATVTVRGFRQHVDDQMVTMFGVDTPNFPGSGLGHYVVGNVGNADATGGSVGLRSAFGHRVKGSVTYSQATARLLPDALIVWQSGPVSRLGERLHDVSTSIEADVPETATRVLIFYRVGNGYATSREEMDGASSVDSRFDIQVRQSLPFLNFTNARWEMLVALRNFFRDPEADQSIYDELLAVRAPKRLVGGVSLHF